MNGGLQEIVNSNPEWYKNIQYEEVKIFIKDNINSASRSFVAIGYYLKYVRDNQLYEEDGYQNIWEFAKGEFGIGKSSASQFMSINDRFSKDGNSPILLDQYKDFSSSKLSEMLTMTEEQLEQVNPTTTIVEIRQIKKPAETVLTSERETEKVAPTQFKPEPKKSNWAIGIFEDDGAAYGAMRNELIHASFRKILSIGNSLDSLASIIFTCYNNDSGYVSFDDDYYTVRFREDSFKVNSDRFKKELAWYKENRYEYDISVSSGEDELPCDTCGHDKGGCCNYDDTPDDYCVVGDKWIPKGDDKDSAETIEADIIQEYHFDIISRYSLADVKSSIGKHGSNLAAYKDCKLDAPVVKNEKMIYDALKLLEEDMYMPELKEPLKPVQPELPILKNNDQRKEFIEAYETWPVWIDLKETGERYYRYNFDNGDSFVIKVYWCTRGSYDYELRKHIDEECYTYQEEYILKPGKHFKNGQTCVTAMVDYLRSLQKK